MLTCFGWCYTQRLVHFRYSSLWNGAFTHFGHATQAAKDAASAERLQTELQRLQGEMVALQNK